MTAGVNYYRNNFKGSVCLIGYKINAHNGLGKHALVVQYREQNYMWLEIIILLKIIKLYKLAYLLIVCC